MGVEEELLAIRLELKGQSQAITGLKAVDKAQKGVGTTTRSSGDEAKRAERKVLGLGTAYGKLGGHAKMALGFLGVGGIFAIQSAVHNTEDLALATSGLSRNFGFATNVASRWGAVMHSRDVDPKALSQAFGTLSSKMVQAGREGGKSLTPFHLLGIAQDEVAKGAKNFEWGLFRVAKALGEEEGGAKRSAAAKALLGKGFQTLTPLFSEGAEGLKEQLHWADEYGVTLDGKTNDAIFGMVKSQRELKVATLGIQLAMTKALMPAIEGGEDQIKEFIKTLNDPDLTADQKIHRIERQFEELEDKLINVLEELAPEIAEHAAELGLKMAGALWNGFLHSDTAGRLAIMTYLFMLFGGGDLVKSGAKSFGGRIGSWVGLGIAGGVVGAYIAFEVWDHLSDQQKVEAMIAAEEIAAAFVNPLIREINQSLDDANIFSILGYDAPNIGEVTPNKLDPSDFGPPIGKGTAPGANWGVLGKGKSPKEQYEGLWGAPPPPGPPPWPAPNKGKGRRRPTSLEVPKLPSLRLGALGSGAGPIVLHNHIHLDGRQVAESVATHTADSESLA